MEKGNFTIFENSYKINENSYNDNFIAATVVIRKKRKFILPKQIWGVIRGALKEIAFCKSMVQQWVKRMHVVMKI